MSWIKDLHATYESCYGSKIAGDTQLMPICHTRQNAQIEVTIDGSGKFRRATIIESGNATLVPCTESSAGRAGSKPVNHPLCDKLQYLAGDFVDYGGEVTSGFAKDPAFPFQKYCDDLEIWATSSNGHPKLDAILKYVKKKQLVKDLVAKKIIPVNSKTGLQIAEWSGDKEVAPPIFKALPANYSPLDAFVRWNVEIAGDPNSSTSKDSGLIESWIKFYTDGSEANGFCFVEGDDAVLAGQHPNKIRHAGDKAKIVSSNDDTGYTYRGRFTASEQAVGVGFKVSQKAHNALRWLIERQGYRNGDLVYVAWSPKGHDIPDPFANSGSLFEIDSKDAQADKTDAPPAEIPSHDVGQHFANQLNKALAGFKSSLKPSERVVIIGVDSATPGRLSLILNRKIAGSEFIARIEQWHTNFAWPQNYSKNLKFVGAPNPEDIAEAAFGMKLDEKLKQATIQRLVPCVIDGLKIPQDLVSAAVNRMSHRMSMDDWEWNKFLGITCAIFRGFSLTKNKEYRMSLETDNTSRDYLYGRLLAIAEHIESRALFLAGERRDTNAARQMQRFADFPFSTWKSLELAIGPYKSQLRSKRGGLLHRLELETDEVMNLFSSKDFKSDKRLSGEFLLAYHCQRRELWAKPVEEDNDDSNTDN